jgi:hypothetical protein
LAGQRAGRLSAGNMDEAEVRKNARNRERRARERQAAALELVEQAERMAATARSPQVAKAYREEAERAMGAARKHEEAATLQAKHARGEL